MQPLYETAATDRVADALRAMPSVGGVAMLTAPAGTGVKGALRLAAANMPHVRLINVTPPSSSPTPRAFFREVAVGLGLTVDNHLSAQEIAFALRDHIKTTHELVVLHGAHRLRGAQLPFVSYLAEELGALVLAGGDTLRMRVTADAELTSLTRLPVEVPRLTLMELQRALGEEFSVEWLETTHGLTGGNWSAIWTMVWGERTRAKINGRVTKDAGAKDAQVLGSRFLLKVAA